MSSIPTKTQQYVLTKVCGLYYTLNIPDADACAQIGTYENLRKEEAPVAKPKANEVLVKVRSVSLQVRCFFRGYFIELISDLRLGRSIEIVSRSRHFSR